MKNLETIRQQYSRGSLDESQVDGDPIAQLSLWLHEAISAGCHEPTAMILSTAGPDLKPSSRVVLMKGLDEKGTTFFTNYESRKGMQLEANPQASLLFFWPEVERQVRIEGLVIKVSPEESDAYFASRPEASRISAAISPQSRIIPDRRWLETSVGTHKCVRSPETLNGVRSPETLNGVPSPTRPSNWGGYRLVPDYFEFWQGRADRLHDRIAYRFNDGVWEIFRLAP